MGSRLGVLRVHAARIGVTYDEYVARVESGEKWCTRCKAWHPLARFGRDRTRYDGRNAKCLSTRERVSPEAKRERAREGYRRYYAGKGGAAIRARVHARKRGIKPLPPDGSETLLDWTAGACVYCGRPADTFDHIVPVAKGGDTTPGNMVPACRSCNSAKKDSDLDDFLVGRSPSHHLFDILDLTYVRLG